MSIGKDIILSEVVVPGSQNVNQPGAIVSNIQNAPTAWTPLNATAGIPYVWLRGDSVVQTGGVISQANDLSGNGRNYTAVNSPTQVNNVVNGQSVFRFSAASTQYLNLPTLAPLSKPQKYALVFVCKASAQAGSNLSFTVCTFGTGSNGWQGHYFTNQAGYQPFSWGGGNGGSQSGSSGIAGFDYFTNWNGIVMQYAGGDFDVPANFTVFSNNVSQTITTSGAVSTNAHINQVGAWDASGGLYFDGDIAEVILYRNANLSAGDLVNMHNYLNTRYGAGVG